MLPFQWAALGFAFLIGALLYRGRTPITVEAQPAAEPAARRKRGRKRRPARRSPPMKVERVPAVEPTPDPEPEVPAAVTVERTDTEADDHGETEETIEQETTADAAPGEVRPVPEAEAPAVAS